MKLNLGCWTHKLEGFINIDIDPNVNPDLVCDASKLPFVDNSIDEIYAGHLLEHFTLKEGHCALSEWKRVLKPGGIITITVPDAEKGLNEYRKGSITLEWYEQIIFGAPDRDQQYHHQVFTDDILFKVVSEHFKEAEIIDDSPHLMGRVNWQTIIKAKR